MSDLPLVFQLLPAALGGGRFFINDLKSYDLGVLIRGRLLGRFMFSLSCLVMVGNRLYLYLQANILQRTAGEFAGIIVLAVIFLRALALVIEDMYFARQIKKIHELAPHGSELYTQLDCAAHRRKAIKIYIVLTALVLSIAATLGGEMYVHHTIALVTFWPLAATVLGTAMDYQVLGKNERKLSFVSGACWVVYGALIPGGFDIVLRNTVVSLICAPVTIYKHDIHSRDGTVIQNVRSYFQETFQEIAMFLHWRHGRV